jgi:hypothetical protein
MDELSQGYGLTLFVRKAKVERDILTYLLINPDAGEIFGLPVLNMSMESVMGEKESHEYDQSD